jgi:peroxiredoxin
MPEKKERIIIWGAICISVIAIVAVAMLSTIGRQSAENVDIVHHYEYERYHESLPSESLFESRSETAGTGSGRVGGAKATLNDVIGAARTWRPAYTFWFGREAPDFTLTDINGKKHKLSDYRGKNVMIIFWATWCGPCRVEVPHLIALRNIIGEDELAMLAISYKNVFLRETTQKVTDFVKRNKINYTVFSTSESTMPSPFSRISGIPCSFFIDKQGKIKLATEGLLSLGEIKAILQAE